MKSKTLWLMFLGGSLLGTLATATVQAAEVELSPSAKEAKVISAAGWAVGEEGLLRFRLEVRDLCDVTKGSQTFERIPCSPWRRLRSNEAAPELLVDTNRRNVPLRGGPIRGPVLRVVVVAEFRPARASKPTVLRLEDVNGAWIVDAAKVKLSEAGLPRDATLTLSEVQWLRPSENSERPVFALSGSEVRGTRQVQVPASFCSRITHTAPTQQRQPAGKSADSDRPAEPGGSMTSQAPAGKTTPRAGRSSFALSECCVVLDLDGDEERAILFAGSQPKTVSLIIADTGTVTVLRFEYTLSIEPDTTTLSCKDKGHLYWGMEETEAFSAWSWLGNKYRHWDPQEDY